MSEIVAQHQVTNGGSVFIYQIENEYGDQWKNVAAKTPNPAAIQYSKCFLAEEASTNFLQWNCWRNVLGMQVSMYLSLTTIQT